MFQRGLYTLSADPVHLGHLDVIRQASEGCETLVVYVTDNDEKRGSYLLSLNARRRLVKQALGGRFPNVEVLAGDALTTDVFLEQGCTVLVRGIRSAEDLAYEKAQMALHERVLPGVEGHVWMVESALPVRQISSSLVKSFASRHVDVSEMVPPVVKAALDMTLHQQVLVGVTGPLAVGKTHVVEGIRKALVERGVPVTTVILDTLVRQVLFEETHGGQRVRDELDRLFPGVRTAGGRGVLVRTLRAAAADALPEQVERLHAVIKPHVLRLFRQAIRGRSGLVLVEWGQLVEDNLLPLVNNRVLVVTSPDWTTLAACRGITPERFPKMLGRQWSATRQVAAIETAIQQSGYGRMFRYTNKFNQPLNESIVDTLAALLPKVTKCE